MFIYTSLTVHYSRESNEINITADDNKKNT